MYMCIHTCITMMIFCAVQKRDYIVEMLQTINPGVSEYTYRYAIDDVMEFERALAGVSLTNVYTGNCWLLFFSIHVDFYALTTKPYADKAHVSTLGPLAGLMPEVR